jgi:hypothetical protein
VDYHRNSRNPVASRLFRREDQSKVPENRKLDSRPDRYCRHTRHIAPPRSDVNLARFDDHIGFVEAYDGYLAKTVKQTTTWHNSLVVDRLDFPIQNESTSKKVFV